MCVFVVKYVRFLIQNWFLCSGTSSASKLPLSNSTTVVNSVNVVAKMNNTLQTVMTKSNALKQEIPMDGGTRLQTGTAKPSSSKGGDMDDMPLNSRIPSPTKHKPGAAPNAQQVLIKSQNETELLSNHTNDHKIGGGTYQLPSITFYLTNF